MISISIRVESRSYAIENCVAMSMSRMLKTVYKTRNFSEMHYKHTNKGQANNIKSKKNTEKTEEPTMRNKTTRK